jgi:hypothetical protein
VSNFSNRKCVSVSVLYLLNNVASSHHLKYYVIVMMYLAPDLLDGGLIGPTKSISHLSNTCKVTSGIKGISSLLLGLPTL